METTDIKDLQKKSWEMYEYIANFCEKYNLRFYVCGGACIGAVRNGGFVPWDDDIDLFMPRPDYEKLHQIWDQLGDSDKYTLCRTNASINFHDSGTLLKDNNTTFINRHSVDEDIHHGYMLDIISLDGCAPTKYSRKIQKLHAAVYSLFNVQRLPDNQGKAIRLLSKFIFTIVFSSKLRTFIWQTAEKRMTKYDFDTADYITELVTGFRYMRNAYPKNVFNGYKMLDFADSQIRVPNDYDTYLRMAFGDYMQLPPMEDRKSKHDVVFSDMHTSYREYRGIKYCVGRK